MNLTTEQEKARGLFSRVLGMPSGNAAEAVLGLDDGETKALADVPTFPPDECRARVKQIYGQALERRQADQGQAGPALAAAAARRNAVRHALQLQCSVSADHAAEIEQLMDDGHRAAVVAGGEVERAVGRKLLGLIRLAQASY